MPCLSHSSMVLQIHGPSAATAFFSVLVWQAKHLSPWDYIMPVRKGGQQYSR